MSFIDEAHGKLTEAYNVLNRRWTETKDQDERARIDAAIKSLDDNLTILVGAALYEAAASVVDATLAMERIVASARIDPFQKYVEELGGVMKGLGDLLHHKEIGERLEPTPESPDPGASTLDLSGPILGSETSISKPASPLEPLTSFPASEPSSSAASAKPEKPPTSSPAGAVILTVSPSTDFSSLRIEYESFFEAMNVRPERLDKVDWWVKQLLKYQNRYQAVSARVNNMPWVVIGVIHAMECGLNFAGHLHNGDPLTGRTTRVPAGLPKKWSPPNSWEESALDALTYEKFHQVTDWSIPHMLYLLEKYNGFGYRFKKIPTPYLWSFSDRYERGKYVKDRVFDPKAISQQCGAAVMLKTLMDNGVSLV